MDRDIVRNDYLGTLPSTLRNRDIHVEFTSAEGEAKAYLIRKYLDADIQREIYGICWWYAMESLKQKSPAGKNAGKTMWKHR